MQPSLIDRDVWLDYLLDQLLPRVLSQARMQGPVLRIWSLGCQNGDEAAGLALALHALLGDEMAAWQLRIFATDTDPLALARARQRVYARQPGSDRWRQRGMLAFENHPGGYRLAKALRNTIMFASHDLLFQPPFPRLDLIVCHTPLALWAMDEQAVILNRFAYVLAANQYLWLVTPTTLTPHSSFWQCIDTEAQLYQRRSSAIPLEYLHLKRPSSLLKTTVQTANDAELYTEELQASLEEREVAYQELEQRLGELEQANQELERLNCLKEDFLAMASHELRTPLTAVLGYGELLRGMLAHPSLEPVTSHAKDLHARSPIEFIDRMLAQGNVMTTLIENLLDVSKMHADVFALTERRVCHVMDLVSRVVEQQAMQTHRQISLESAPQDLVGGWDERRIEQILTNLITNALKFSPVDTEVSVRVQGEPTTAAESVLITVRDQGCGISQQDQEHLFEPFYRGKKDQTSVEGLGLGLYIASEIVKRHRGRIWVESISGRSTTFYVCLPLIKEE